MPNGTEQSHRIRTWSEFRKFVNKHRKHADNVTIETDDSAGVHMHIRE